MTTTYFGKLKLFLTLKGNISMDILMEALLLHLNLSLLKSMETYKSSKIQTSVIGIYKTRWSSVP